MPPWPSARDPKGAKEPPAGFSVQQSPARDSSHHENPFRTAAGGPHTRCFRMFSPAAGCFACGDSVLGSCVVRSLQPSTSSLLDRSILVAHWARGATSARRRSGRPRIRSECRYGEGFGAKARIQRVLLANGGIPAPPTAPGSLPLELSDPSYARRPLRSVPLAPAGRPRGIDLTSDLTHGKQKGNQKTMAGRCGSGGSRAAPARVPTAARLGRGARVPRETSWRGAAGAQQPA